MKQRVFLFLLAVNLPLFADHRDPYLYPSKGDAAWCDTAMGHWDGGVIKVYEDIYRAETPYSIAPTRKDPNAPIGQDIYYSPAIDGFLEDSLWRFAETLLVNTWTDAGMSDVCRDSPPPEYTGPGDLHAIWRFMYNREGLFVSAEVFDDVYDVDSLGGWYLQDGVEISIDPYDWGYYGAGNWKTTTGTGGIFKRYYSNNNQMIPCGGGTPCSDESHLSYLHILKRMNQEPYLAGLIHGLNVYNYSRGEEASNFRLGDPGLYGMQFAAKPQGVDEYFRHVYHLEFKFPFHTDLWKSLDNPGNYFDGTGLPKAGILFKMDLMNNDDDSLGWNPPAAGSYGPYPGMIPLGRRRDLPFSQEASGHDHWSDTKYYQSFKYVSSLRVVASPFVGSKIHGDPRLAGVWVDAATGLKRSQFTQAGAVRLWGTNYFYDSTSGIGGEIKGASKVADYRLAPSSASKYGDTLFITPVIGQPSLTLFRQMTLGYSQVEGRWVESRLQAAPFYCDPDSTVYSWVPASDTALEFRFVPLAKLDSNGLRLNPQYNGSQRDSVRIYRFKTQQLLTSYAYTSREAVTGRSMVHFTYEFDKLPAYETSLNFPKHLVVNWAGQQRIFALYPKFDTRTFGETGLNKNSRIFLARTYPLNRKQYTFILWDKYKHQIFYMPDTLNQGQREWVAFYPDMVMGFDSSKGKFWEKSLDVGFAVDSVQMVGYSDSTDAQSFYSKGPWETWGDSVWIRQQVKFVINQQDTFKFWDTTRTQAQDPLSPNYIVTICKGPGTGLEGAAQPLNPEIANFPNPFNPAATIVFSIPAKLAGERFDIKIFNVRGQLVRTLLKGQVGLGGIARRRVVWPGSDNLGRALGSGLYYYTLTVKDQVKRGVMVMVK